MTSIPLDEVVIIGESICAAKRYILVFGFLWIWDYALTFGDEVNYVWNWESRKSRVFVLYLLNRYSALLYVIWILSIVALWWSGSSQKACNWTVCLETLYFSFATIFAQTILTLRVYAVTRSNKLFAAVLSCVTLAQFSFGCYVGVQAFILGARVWPVMDPISFRSCYSNQPEFYQVITVSFSLVYDLLAFLMVIWEGLRTGGFGRLGFTMLFDKIVEDATVYFLVMFSSHLLVEFCVLFAPKSYKYLPASSNVIFISIMATRLLLSLRKAAGPSRSSLSSEDFDLDLVTSVVFAGAQTTTEHGAEVGASDA